MLTSGNWIYDATTGDVIAIDGDSRVRVAAVAIDDTGEHDDEADANGAAIAKVPELVAMVRDLATGECAEVGEPGSECGECIVCQAKKLVDEVGP